jgi:hypothetical protein
MSETTLRMPGAVIRIALALEVHYASTTWTRLTLSNVNVPPQYEHRWKCAGMADLPCHSQQSHSIHDTRQIVDQIGS